MALAAVCRQLYVTILLGYKSYDPTQTTVLFNKHLPGFAANPQNSRITHFHQNGCFHTCIRFFLVHLFLSCLYLNT